MSDERSLTGRAPHPLWIGALLLLVSFVLSLPTVPLLEFSSGSENLNLATALEIRRNGRWLVPTLDGEPRVAKPPLTAWITAASVRPLTASALATSDPARREAAEAWLAWQARWPFVAASCLLLVAVWELGRVLHDWRTGLIAAVVCATTLLFLRFARAATTDVQLALWVTLTNLLLVRAIVCGDRWLGFLGAGATLALAFMSKGPVALVQTVAPALVFMLMNRPRAADAQPSHRGGSLAPIAFGVVVFLAVALPWYGLVLATFPQAWARWQIEVTREGATGQPPGAWYQYLVLVPLLVPWTAFFIGGIGVIVRDVSTAARTSRSRAMLLPLLMVIVPIVIMSFFRDRKERYLLPMIGPAAIVAARAVVEHFDTRRQGNLADRTVSGAHWATLAAVAVGFPTAGATMLRTLDGQPWYAVPTAVVAALVGGVVVLAGIVAHRRYSASIVVTSALIMVAMHGLFLWGYRDSREGRSEMKPLAALILEQHPTATVVSTGVPRKMVPSDLSIYMNRTVRWVEDVTALRNSPVPVVVVMRQGAGDPPPAPPAGARQIGRVARDRNWWYAVVLER